MQRFPALMVRNTTFKPTCRFSNYIRTWKIKDAVAKGLGAGSFYFKVGATKNRKRLDKRRKEYLHQEKKENKESAAQFVPNESASFRLATIIKKGWCHPFFPLEDGTSETFIVNTNDADVRVAINESAELFSTIDFYDEDGYEEFVRLAEEILLQLENAGIVKTGSADLVAKYFMSEEVQQEFKEYQEQYLEVLLEEYLEDVLEEEERKAKAEKKSKSKQDKVKQKAVDQ